MEVGWLFDAQLARLKVSQIKLNQVTLLRASAAPQVTAGIDANLFSNVTYGALECWPS